MKRWAVGLLCFLIAGVAAANTVTLVGEYVWKKGKPHAIRAVFTANGEGEWTVDFQFKHYGKHAWTGRATGDIAQGRLSGRVFNPKESREFTFEGETRNGAFEGTHAELLRDGPKPTGTLVLRPESAAE